MAERKWTKQRIIALRMKAGLTQHAFAKALKLSSASSLSHWEAGMYTPSGPNAERLEAWEKKQKKEEKSSESDSFYGLMLDRTQEKWYRTIPKFRFAWLQKQAKRNLVEGKGNKEDREYWLSIVEGKVPFGFELREK